MEKLTCKNCDYAEIFHGYARCRLNDGRIPNTVLTRNGKREVFIADKGVGRKCPLATISTEETRRAIDFLVKDGWKMYEEDSECLYYAKRFPSKFRCSCNGDKEGVQILLNLYIHEHDDYQPSYEVKLSAELPNSRWVKLDTYSYTAISKADLEDPFAEAKADIPNLISAWELLCENTNPNK